jgi:hypothetical protein
MVMKISGLGPAKGADATRRKKAEGKGDEFAERLKQAAAASGSAATVESPPVTSADSLLAVQERPDATRERSRGLACQYGATLLDRLEEIRLAILAGAVAKDKLASIAQTVRQRRQKSDDPRLNAIIDEIELRCEVEIAKLTRPLDEPRRPPG